jgi:hypothetical protein
MKAAQYLWLFFLCSRLYAFSGVTPWVNLFQGELSGSLGTGPGAQIGSKRESSMGCGLDLHVLGKTMRFEYENYETMTSLRPLGSMTFDGNTYLSGDNIDMEFLWDTFDFSYRWLHYDLNPPGGIRTFSWDLYTGLQGAGFETTIFGGRAGTTLKTKETSDFLIIPYLGFEANWRISDMLLFEGGYKISTVDILGSDLAYDDFKVGLRLFVNRKDDSKTSVGISYRKKMVDAEFSSGAAASPLDFSIDGLQASWQLHF